jgi:hypothetical protein
MAFRTPGSTINGKTVSALKWGEGLGEKGHCFLKTPPKNDCCLAHKLKPDAQYVVQNTVAE